MVTLGERGISQVNKEEEPIGNKVVEVYPGQGTLKVPFGVAFYDSSDAAKRVFEEADDILGYSISDLCFVGPQDQLIQTKNAQVARFVNSWAVLKFLEEQGKLDDPDFVVGHSLGEFTALARAGLGFGKTLRLVHSRSSLMHQFRSEDGVMRALLGADEKAIEEVCEEISKNGFGFVGIASRNSLRQTVISGNRKAVEAAIEKIRPKKDVGLVVSDGFHSPLMRRANTEFREELKSVDFSDIRIPISLNSTGEIYRPGIDPVEKLTDALLEQMEAAVLFYLQTKNMILQGAGHFVEIGGNIVSGIVGSIDKRVKTTSINTPQDVFTFANNH